MTQAETGASSADTGIPATQHQEQVLAGDQQGNKNAAGAGGGDQADVPASPNQQQVLTEPAAGSSGEGDVASGQQPADLIAEARDMAKAGDEEGCMQKLAQAKNLLGIDCPSLKIPAPSELKQRTQTVSSALEASFRRKRSLCLRSPAWQPA